MDLQAVTDTVTAVVEARGLEIDRLETAAAGRRMVLRIFLDGDGPAGRGPSLDDIADATRAISAALDETPAVGNDPYVLEVSSRGVTRPLTEPKHYRRNVGRLAVASLVGGEKLTGRILATDADGVRFDVDGAERAVPYQQIQKAVVQVELNRAADDDEDAEESAGLGDEEE